MRVVVTTPTEYPNRLPAVIIDVVYVHLGFYNLDQYKRRLFNKYSPELDLIHMHHCINNLRQINKYSLKLDLICIRNLCLIDKYSPVLNLIYIRTYF